MRIAIAIAAAALLLPGIAAAATPISCRELPKAEQFVHTRLSPGPNTREALHHLAAAKAAPSPRQCSEELAKVDYFARRSLAADRRR